MNTNPLSDLRRADAHARWRVAETLALRTDAAANLADAPVHLAGWMDDEDDDEIEYEVVGGVAIVPVRGALMDRAAWCWDGYDAIHARFEAAYADPSVRAVLADIDSPGGMVAGLFDCMRALRAAKAASEKRCVAWVSAGAYSAAYGIASTCDEIVCSDTGGVGSVGVITSITSVAKMLKEAGIDMRVVSSGTEKTDGHPAVEISDGAESRITARVRELAAMFFGEVGIGRAPLSADALTALDGGVRYGRASLAAGLADRISTRAALLAELQAAPATLAARQTTTGAARATATRKTMNEELTAALTAATGETDTEKAVGLLIEKHAAATRTVEALTADLGAANARAQAAEGRVATIERDALITSAKAAGQWALSLDPFLSTLSVEQLRAWQTTAPRVVPQGEIQTPAGPVAQSAGAMPAEVAAAVAKARDGGWKTLTAREKHAISQHNSTLAQTLRAG
jgi:capsid assembly protease